MTRNQRRILARLDRSHADLVEARKILRSGMMTSPEVGQDMDIGNAIEFTESAIEWLPPEPPTKKKT